jgi:restriction modification system, type I
MRYTIGQLAEIIDGDRGKNYPKQDEFYPQGYCLFLNTGNVTKEGFIFEENQFIMKEKDEALRKGKLKRGDIVYTTRGTVGNAGYYNSSVPYENVRINSGMVILRSNGEIVDARFLYQILKSEYYRPYFKQYCTGSAQPQLPIKNFSQIYLNVPDIKTQHRIADILSVYDNLIENNQKQIKLLEEAAQRLYKEWFVDLNFPGHENTKIVDGVPEGWSRGLLKELISVNYGKDHKKAPDDGNIPVYGSGGLMRKCNKSLFSGEAVLIPRKGSLNNIMYVDETFWTVDTMFYATMKQPHTAVFVYFFVKAFDMYSMNIGAAVPSMTAKILDAMDVVIPDKETLEKFDKLTKTYFNKIKTLQGQNERLKIARDLLLAKLMSGEVEV